MPNPPTVSWHMTQLEDAASEHLLRETVTAKSLSLLSVRLIVNHRYWTCPLLSSIRLTRLQIAYTTFGWYDCKSHTVPSADTAANRIQYLRLIRLQIAYSTFGFIICLSKRWHLPRDKDITSSRTLRWMLLMSCGLFHPISINFIVMIDILIIMLWIA